MKSGLIWAIGVIVKAINTKLLGLTEPVTENISVDLHTPAV